MNAPTDLDALLVDPTRLAIAALLAAAEWAEFPFVRDAVGLSDSALSKQAATLERAGYVEVSKGYIGKRPRTWLKLSEAGRSVLSAHIEELQRIADDAARSGPAPGHSREHGPGGPVTTEGAGPTGARAEAHAGAG